MRRVGLEDHLFALKSGVETMMLASSFVVLVEAPTHSPLPSRVPATTILNFMSSQHLVRHRICHLKLSAFNMAVHNAAHGV